MKRFMYLTSTVREYIDVHRSAQQQKSEALPSYAIEFLGSAGDIVHATELQLCNSLPKVVIPGESHFSLSHASSTTELAHRMIRLP